MERKRERKKEWGKWAAQISSLSLCSHALTLTPSHTIIHWPFFFPLTHSLLPHSLHPSIHPPVYPYTHTPIQLRILGYPRTLHLPLFANDSLFCSSLIECKPFLDVALKVVEGEGRGVFAQIRSVVEQVFQWLAMKSVALREKEKERRRLRERDFDSVLTMTWTGSWQVMAHSLTRNLTPYSQSWWHPRAFCT